MKCFQRAKEVLDELYLQIPCLDESSKDLLIRDELEQLRESYQKLTNGIVIDYSSVATRFAYYYRYVPAHASVVYQLLNRSDILANTFNQNSLSISCLGGGPGSEFWGMLRYREVSHRLTNIFCDMYDKEKIWSEFWNSSKVSKKVKTSKYLFPDFKYLDALNDEYCGKYYNLCHADLFTMSFFLSEIPRIETSMRFFETLLNNAKRGSIFLLIDNTKSGTQLWFDSLVQRHNRAYFKDHIATLDQSDFVKFDVCESPNDRKEHLGIFYEKFHKTEQPRRNVPVVYRIYRKQ